jgi:hypothetical protein
LEELAQMKQRGSAMVFVVVMFAVMAVVMLTTISVTSGAARLVRRSEDQVKMRYALEGAAEQAVGDYLNGTLASLPVTRNLTLGGVSTTVTITDNSLVSPRTLRVAGTMTLHGRTVTDEIVVGMRKTPSPFYYSLFVNNGFSFTGRLVAGWANENGDIYARGNLSITGTGSAINGDVEAEGTASVSGATISGSVVPNASVISFPTLDPTLYTQNADVIYTKTSISNYTFATSSGNYQLIVRSGNLSISGTFTGKGCIFVDGEVNVPSNITYGNSDSKLVVLATGPIKFGANTSNPRLNQGYYCGASLEFPSAGLTISSGGLVVGSVSNPGNPLAVIHDPTIWKDSAEAKKLRVPGFWP